MSKPTCREGAVALRERMKESGLSESMLWEARAEMLDAFGDAPLPDTLRWVTPIPVEPLTLATTPAELDWKPGPKPGPPRHPYDVVALFSPPHKVMNGQTLGPYLHTLRVGGTFDHDFDAEGNDYKVRVQDVWVDENDEGEADDETVTNCAFWAYLGPCWAISADDPPFEPGKRTRLTAEEERDLEKDDDSDVLG